jgi:hypothetical protein
LVDSVERFKLIVNTAEGINCSFLKPIQDLKLIGPQVIIRLSEIITVPCPCMR